MGVSSSSVLTQKSPDWDAYLKVRSLSWFETGLIRLLSL